MSLKDLQDEIESLEVRYEDLTDEELERLDEARDEYALEMGEEPILDEDCFMSDAEADADVLRMAGMGTDEDYGYFGGEWD